MGLAGSFFAASIKVVCAKCHWERVVSIFNEKRVLVVGFSIFCCTFGVLEATKNL